MLFYIVFINLIPVFYEWVVDDGVIQTLGGENKKLFTTL